MFSISDTFLTMLNLLDAEDDVIVIMYGPWCLWYFFQQLPKFGNLHGVVHSRTAACRIPPLDDA